MDHTEHDVSVIVTRRGGGDGHGPRLQQVEHSFLDHLGVGGQLVEGAAFQTGEHGVGDIADTRLANVLVPAKSA